MKRIAPAEAWTGTTDCLNCTIKHSVLFARLSEAEFEQLHRPIYQLHYPAGSTIYSIGQPASALFTIRSGLVKLTRYLPDGTQRIVRLLQKTDLLGLEAMIEPEYPHTATALQTTEVCRLPVETVKDLSTGNPQLFHEVMARWHRALSDADRWIAEFSTGAAIDRVVRLLLWLARGTSDGSCRLFSREDLGAVLGLTTETVSRVMADLKRRAVIAEPATNHFDCDLPALERIIDRAPDMAAPHGGPRRDPPGRWQ